MKVITVNYYPKTKMFAFPKWLPYFVFGQRLQIPFQWQGKDSFSGKGLGHMNSAAFHSQSPTLCCADRQSHTACAEASWKGDNLNP